MSVAEMVLRPATAADIEEVYALERATEFAPHWPIASYRAIVAGEGVRRRLIVARADGRLAGFVVGVVPAGETEGELESVVVTAGMRRCGVARALCGAVMDWCRGVGAKAMVLEVRVGSVGPIELYRKLGFERVGMRKGYYREPEEDGVLMRAEL